MEAMYGDDDDGDAAFFFLLFVIVLFEYKRYRRRDRCNHLQYLLSFDKQHTLSFLSSKTW
jgi:hypothetical protein